MTALTRPTANDPEDTMRQKSITIYLNIAETPADVAQVVTECPPHMARKMTKAVNRILLKQMILEQVEDHLDK